MPDYYLKLEGPNGDRKQITCDNVEEARAEAVRYLGNHLIDHPEFASDGHWRVNVEDVYGTSILHVVVATVPSSRTESWQI